MYNTVKSLEMEIDRRTKFRPFWGGFHFGEVPIELTVVSKCVHFVEVSISRCFTLLYFALDIINNLKKHECMNVNRRNWEAVLPRKKCHVCHKF